MHTAHTAIKLLIATILLSTVRRNHPSPWQDENGMMVSSVCEQLGGTCFGLMHLRARSNLRKV
jgi:hypothetical protein